MQTVILGASQLKMTRSHMATGSSAGTGDRWTSRLPVALDLVLSRDDLAEIDSIMAAAVPLGGPSPEGMT